MGRFNLTAEGFTFQLDSELISIDLDSEIILKWRENYLAKNENVWGPGGGVMADVLWQGLFPGSVTISWHHRYKGFILSGFIIPTKKDRFITQIPLFSWIVDTKNVDKWRMLIQSGHQGFSGSLSLAEDLRENRLSQDITLLSNAENGDFVIGNLSFNRTNVFVQREKMPDGSVLLSAYLDYGRMRVPAGKEIALEDVLILPGQNGLALLEEYAERVKLNVRPCFTRSMNGIYNQWYANWTPTSDHGSADLAEEGASVLVSSPFHALGVTLLGSGVWHNRAAFGEEESWPGLFPAGLDGLAKNLRLLGTGFMHGGFWGKISECSTVFKNHPDWMARGADGNPLMISSESWGACAEPYYLLDITQPEAQDWLREQWEKIAEISSGYYWLDFYGMGMGVDLEIGTKLLPYFKDDRLSFPFETDRLMTRVIRETVGSQGIIGVYTSPTFNLVGQIDRARVGMDCGALDLLGAVGHDAGNPTEINLYQTARRRWQHIQAVARNLAANYYCHDRFWMNDADPIMVGLHDRDETLEEARVRLMLSVNTGSFVSIGEQIDKIPPGRTALLKKALPACGKSARPIDLLQEKIPGTFDLHLVTPWDDWHVLTLINWSDEEKIRSINFCQLGLGGAQHVYEFWEQKYFGVKESTFQDVIPRRSCRVYCLRAARRYPWLLSSSFHITQDAVTLSNVRWDPVNHCLSGELFRPADIGNLLFTVPDDFSVINGFVNDKPLHFFSPERRLISTNFQSDGNIQIWKIWFFRKGEDLDQ